MRNRDYAYIGKFVEYLRDIIKIISNLIDKLKGKDVDWDL